MGPFFGSPKSEKMIALVVSVFSGYRKQMVEFASFDRAKRNVAILVVAQSILGAQLPMIFTIGGLAGQTLATNVCFATLPISLIVLASMVSATPMSAFMQKYGRKAGFFVGAAAGAIGAAVGAWGLILASFPVFLVGSFITGIYLSAQGFYRFAATDTASEDFRPKAISYVLAAGLVNAIIGPQLVKVTSDAMVVPFLGTYLTVIGINVIGSFVFLFLDIPKPVANAEGTARGRTRRQLLATPRIAVAIICAMVSYALMNLVMTSTPLAVVGCGYTQNNAADIVSAHVLAMFIPSFFTGHLIARFGVERIVATGLVILAFAEFPGVLTNRRFTILANGGHDPLSTCERLRVDRDGQVANFECFRIDNFEWNFCHPSPSFPG